LHLLLLVGLPTHYQPPEIVESSNDFRGWYQSALKIDMDRIG
jgi:hypothetical protein